MEKKQRRSTIIDEENTAQQEFLEFLENKSTSSQELIVTVELKGELDLEVLTEKGFRDLRTIQFSDGEITGIRGIPKDIEYLTCNNNLLIDLQELPTSLIELRVSNNILHSLDVSKLSSLEILNIGQNEFREISGLPESLRELYCRSNGLLSLDLLSAENLCILHCEENPNLILFDVPESVYDSKYPEQFTHANKNTKSLSEKSIKNIRKYYDMKKEYDSQLQKIRKDHKDKLPPCKRCSKAVGMIFSRKPEAGKTYSETCSFSVSCGDHPSCGFRFEFTVDAKTHIDDEISYFLSEVEEDKQVMIIHKMHSLFHHMGDKKALEGFEKMKSNYESTLLALKRYSERKELLHEIKLKMIPKQKLIQDKIKLVTEALDAGDTKRAVEIQYMEIFPLSQYIQRQLYEVIEMKITYSNDSEILDSVLFQQEVSIYHSEIDGYI